MSSGYDDGRYYDDRDEERGPSAVRRAREQVRGAAVALLITGILSLLAALLSIANVFTMDKQFDRIEQQWDNDPKLNAQQRQEMKNLLATYRDALKVGLPISVGLGVITALITIVGSVRMMNLSGRGLAITGSVLSMIPCVSGCCILGLPVGIWALLVLSRAEVKAGFAAARAGRGPHDEYPDPRRPRGEFED